MPTTTTQRRALGPARLNHRHQQIVNWLVMHPDRPLGECAQVFGYTQPWLSLIVHSDSFQAVYRARCREAGAVAVHTITNKLSGTAAVALDATKLRIEGGGASEKFIGDTMKTTLQALGYTPTAQVSGPSLHQHNHLHVDANTLEQARERILQEGSVNGK